MDDVSAWSGETDEGLEVSDSLLQGAELQNEEYLMNISARLQAAVEKLLVAITETTNQVWPSPKPTNRVTARCSGRRSGIQVLGDSAVRCSASELYPSLAWG